MTDSIDQNTGSTCPLPCIRVRKVSCTAIASSTLLPMTRSVMTEVAACEIEQPTAS